MYKLLRTFLFLFEAEKAHGITMKMLSTASKISMFRFLIKNMFAIESNALHKTVFGIEFKNAVGLAAGFDKNAEYIDALSLLGFGFIEIGTVTPKPQDGNPQPRLFRLKRDEAIINRMGFNNKGVDAVIENLKAVKTKDIIIGGNIGKNKNTPNENAIHDYTYCFEKLYPYVHYFVINVSSPNTPGLRELQEKKPLTEIIDALTALRQKKEKQKPILLKIAPDLTIEQMNDIVDIVNETQLDGLIVSNTTLDRTMLTTNEAEVNAIGAGGLSGKPLLHKSNEVLKYFKEKTTKPIIGVGGIHSSNDAKDKIKNGADLIQLYTGFIYEGPALVKRILRGM
jgi:dihydroorotate dehydrogenase